jgi:hypothetical protein
VHKKFILMISVATLLVSTVSAQNASKAPSSFTVPIIVAKKVFRNQTQPIPQTTLFTPSVTGIFRVSVYMAMTSPIDGTSGWTLGWNWTDDAGAEQTYLAVLFDNAAPPYDFALSNGSSTPPVPFTFEAVAGQPISYSVYGPGDPQGGTYGFVLVVERL